MHVFYTPDIQTRAELPEEEAQHCVRVLRLNIGDQITLTDGKGNFYRAEISAATNKRCMVNILETIYQEPLWNGHLHIAMAPTKNMDRTEWFAEKATSFNWSVAGMQIAPSLWRATMMGQNSQWRRRTRSTLSPLIMPRDFR